MTRSLEDIRREYRAGSLDEQDLSPNPFTQFQQWMDDAFRAQLIEPSAMTLATVGADGAPTARVVLLKGADERGFVFFTNYESKKGSDLAGNANASLLFFWKELERQVRIKGVTERTSREESAKYFATRPRESQLAAWASRQSSSIADRAELIRAYDAARDRFDGAAVPLPDYWGGFRLVPRSFEFWQGRENRLHDRIAYEKKRDGWSVSRLAP